MKRKFGIFSVLTLIVIFLMSAGTTFAQITNYDADFQVQNLSDTNQASVVITFYNQDGSVAATVSDTIPAGSSTTYSPLPGSVPAGFNGSVVISSDQPVAAIANVKGNSGAYGSSYSSFDQGSSSVGLPLINKDFFGINTWFNVQNTGSAATTVTVSYSGTSCTENATIQPSAAATFDQSTNTCLPSAYNGAATITTGNPSDTIVATVMQAADIGLFAYNGFATGSTDPVFPLVTNNWFGIETGIQIQNTGSTATTVTVSYTPSQAGTACTETGTIQPGAAETFAINALSFPSQGTTSNCVLGQGWVGSAQVTTNSASQPLVGIVNQTNFANKGGSSYGAFDPASATGTVVMPLIMDAYNIWTGWSVMNVGSSDTVTCAYSGLGSNTNVVQTLNTNEAFAIQNLNSNSGGSAPLPAGYIGSVTCTAAGSGQLLGVVNQANMNVAPGTGDGTLTYEAFNN